ncbi:MAG: class I SAM-dependent methyltransferase [Caryophanon sp.]|nr:class I SAM-dependent methyltransferase [Caryophanon sp.]
MNEVNKTLYIPLYGKAYVSQKRLFLRDDMAERIWASEGFSLTGKAKSKWLAYYMGMRAAVFDDWVTRQLNDNPEAVVLHIGCGLDSRVLRIGTKQMWYDIDFAEVIDERKRYYDEAPNYRMIAADIRTHHWRRYIRETRCAIVVMEGVSMYVTNEELRAFMEQVSTHFDEAVLLMDCYTELAAKLSAYKNPVHDVGVSRVYGVRAPQTLQGEAFTFAQEHDMTPAHFVQQLSGIERLIFRKLYAGSFSRELYRLFEYKKKG